MCTLTWFGQPGGYQLFFNRDERRTRRPAHPPESATAGATRYLSPRDGDFGGSWICVNERGLTLCLLNGHSADDPSEPAEGFSSRGELPTALIDRPSLTDVSSGLRDRRLDRFRAFVLAGFAADGSTASWDWRGGRLGQHASIDSSAPLISSSFDSLEVRRHRAELYARMRLQHFDDPEEFHLAYHESHAPERGPHSPCMHRPDGETVSFSWIKVGPEGICFHYSPHSPCVGRPSDRPLCMALRRASG